VPPGTSNPQPTQTSIVAGAEIKLSTSKTCVRPGTTLTSKVTVHKPRRGRFKRIKRVEFLVNNAHVRTDRRAPFSLRLFIDGSQSGKTYTLKARVFSKLRHGKTVKQSLSVRFLVCST
jgi:hypothetical protein